MKISGGNGFFSDRTTFPQGKLAGGKITVIESIVAEKKEFDIFYLLAYEKKLNNTPALSIQCIRELGYRMEVETEELQ